MLTTIMTLIKSIVMFLCIALSVGFYTLMERKVLSYIQLRKGPNKAGYLGLPQPLADAAKLFSKENPKIFLSMKPLYMMSPVIATFVMLTTWALYLTPMGISMMKLGMFFFIVVSSLNVYSIMLAGWASNSKYALLGSIRAVAQTISYEISMALVIMTVLMLSLSLNLENLSKVQMNIWFLFIIPFIASMWFITSLAETNRAPFDLAEGESELVSGFNIEYGSGEFALLFIAEYGSILFISMMTSCMFLMGFMSQTGLMSIYKMMMVAYLFLWTRGSYPRMRYDTLMSLTWKTFLTISITSTTMLICHIQ